MESPYYDLSFEEEADPLTALLVNRRGGDSDLAQRSTDVSVAAYENEGLARVSHNWPAGPGAHTVEMSLNEAASGVFIETIEDGDEGPDVFFALSPREARTLGRALLSIADEVDARVRLGA